MLIGYLLHKHKTWSKCRLRLFTVAELETNSEYVVTQLQSLLKELRIKVRRIL